jgi:hypothetical protein
MVDEMQFANTATLASANRTGDDDKILEFMGVGIGREKALCSASLRLNALAACLVLKSSPR